MDGRTDYSQSTWLLNDVKKWGRGRIHVPVGVVRGVGHPTGNPTGVEHVYVP